jgi:hypothetical protein
MKKSILIEKRKLARELKKRGWSNLKIGRYLVVNKNSIKKWLDMDEDDIGNDGRGWQKGKLKKHNEVERQQVLKIRERLEQIPGAAIGPKAIKSEYRQRFGTETSEWFIKQTIREYKEKKRWQPKGKIYSGHVDYPVQRLRKSSKMMMYLDFMTMGARQKSGEKAYLLSCKYVHPYNSGMVSQVSARTSDEVIRTLSHTWRIYAKPDLVKMNYNSAFGANLSRQRCIGKLAICLLNLGITPFYSAADGVDDNVDTGRIGTIFSKEFCRQLSFHRSQKAKLKIRGFYLEYSTGEDSSFEQLRNSIPSFKSPFAGVDIENRNVKYFLKSRIFFSCPVRAKREEGAPGTCGVIKILAVEIKLPAQLIDAVMFCQLDLRKKN